MSVGLTLLLPTTPVTSHCQSHLTFAASIQSYKRLRWEETYSNRSALVYKIASPLASLGALEGKFLRICD